MRVKVKWMGENRKEIVTGTKLRVTRNPMKVLQEVPEVTIPSFSPTYGSSMISYRR